MNTVQHSMIVFGLPVALFGLVGVIAPALIPKLLFFPSVPDDLIFIRATAQASLAMGIYYLVAGFRNMEPFIYWSIPVRLWNAAVFTAMVASGTAPFGWLIVAGLELGGGVTTACFMSKNGGRSNEV